MNPILKIIKKIFDKKRKEEEYKTNVKNLMYFVLEHPRKNPNVLGHDDSEYIKEVQKLIKKIEKLQEELREE